MLTPHAPGPELVDCILYLAALLADRARPIDRYIDYFGGATHHGTPLVRAA